MENKTSKYFKYAIGEIVLVVIGILIALQINNWNEIRKAKDQSDIYLKNLDTEINQNILIIEAIGKNIKRLEAISQHYHSKLFDKTSKVPDSVISNFILKINPINTFKTSQTVLQDFISSGYLKNVNDEKLKNNILFLESRYQSVSDSFTEINDQYNDYIQPYLMKYGDYTEIIDSVYTYKVRKAEFGHTREAFLNSKTLSNQLMWYIAFLGETHEFSVVSGNMKLKNVSNNIKEYLQND